MVVDGVHHEDGAGSLVEWFRYGVVGLLSCLELGNKVQYPISASAHSYRRLLWSLCKTRRRWLPGSYAWISPLRSWRPGLFFLCLDDPWWWLWKLCIQDSFIYKISRLWQRIEDYCRYFSIVLSGEFILTLSEFRNINNCHYEVELKYSSVSNDFACGFIS